MSGDKKERSPVGEIWQSIALRKGKLIPTCRINLKEYVPTDDLLKILLSKDRWEKINGIKKRRKRNARGN